MVEDPNTHQVKVVTANKLLPSILHGSSSLLPAVLSDNKPKDEPGKALLLESIDDDTLWYNHIKVAKDGELLVEACSMFPNFWKVYHRCALYHLFHKRTRQAFEVYSEAIKKSNDYTLYTCYLKFLYHMASVHEYIAALFTAVDKVGLDLRSDALWKELITILVKIYNCKLMEQNIHTGLLPNLFTSESIVSSGGGPLYPSEAEQIVFRGINSLDKKEQTYVQLYSDVNHIRKAFQRWLKTPTNNLKHAWDGYSIFENAVSTATVLCTKLLTDGKAVYDVSMKVYDKLSLMYKKVYPAKPACKRQLTDEPSYERDHDLGFWIEIIQYEETNPLNLSSEEVVDRIAYTFRAALTPHVFASRLWFMYFQFLLANAQPDRGITELKLALSHFLNDDVKMHFILAAFFDESGRSEEAVTEFKRLIDPGLKVADEGDVDKEACHLRQILQFDGAGSGVSVLPMNLIHYLNYVRRNHGRTKWREDLQLILTKSDLLSWELYWYAADTEVCCFRDVSAAVGILNEAQHSMPFDMHYTILHLRFLLNMGLMVDVRVLLSQLLAGATVVGENKCKLSASDKMQLWHFWLHVEYFYGSKSQFTQVQSLYVQSRIATEVGLDTFAEKSNRGVPSSVRQLFGDIGAAFIKTHMDSSKRVATEDMNSVVELRQRLFCGGIDYDDLDPIFALGVDQISFSSDGATSRPSSSDEKQASPSNFMHRSTVDSGQHHPRLSIVRPDVTLMTPLDPGNSSILETMATLHGSRRPVLPEKGRAIDAVATPPKVLFDLMRVLPVPLSTSSFPKMYGSNEAVDYLLKSLEDTDFSHMPLKEYVPLPVNQLLHLRNAASGNDHLFEPNLDSFVEKDTKDPNIGLFSVLQYVDSYVGADGSSHKARNESKKRKIAI